MVILTRIKVNTTTTLNPIRNLRLNTIKQTLKELFKRFKENISLNAAAIIVLVILSSVTLMGYGHAENMFNERVFGKYISYFDHTNIDPPKNTVDTKLLNEQSLLAISWVQKSAEYQALAHQAFNIARRIFDDAKQKSIPNPAVIVDLDETILDNSPYQASLIGTYKQYSTKTWNEWIKEEKAQAIPGAIDFINHVNDNGGTVFFISQRKESSTNNQSNDLELATINNMQSLGITGVSEETLLLRGECFKKNEKDQKIDDKQLRREAILNNINYENCLIKENDNKSNKYNIVMLLGDNLNDFYFDNVNSDNKERKRFVEVNKDQLGLFEFDDSTSQLKPAYITIPNPMYGGWIDALYYPKKDSELTISQQDVLRKQSLIKWDGISK